MKFTQSGKTGKWKSYLEYSSLGIEMGASVVVGFLIGDWLDTKLGTAPIMLFFWIICGFIAGMRSVFRLLKKNMKKKDENLSNEQ